MVRLKNIELSKSLECVKSLINGNIPLCLIDMRQDNSMEILKEIAFKADLFIAVENINSLEEAYTAAGNGAQFFILNDFSEKLAQDLTNSGFYYIPRINTKNEIPAIKKLNIECVIMDNKVYSTTDENLPHDSKDIIFKIIDLPQNINDYEKWINSQVKMMLGLNYCEVIISNNIGESEKLFAETFASTQKCKIVNGNNNFLILECNNVKKAADYFKWRNIFIDPEKSILDNGRVIQSPLDTKLNGFTIILKEKEIL